MQQIVGEWDFHEITLDTGFGILVPRPETEELVELCLQDLPQMQQAPLSSATEPVVVATGAETIQDGCDPFFRVLDIGVGTGAIGLALLHARPDLHVDGIDIEAAAVALANKNALKIGVQERYVGRPSLCSHFHWTSQYADAAVHLLHLSRDLECANPSFFRRCVRVRACCVCVVFFCGLVCCRFLVGGNSPFILHPPTAMLMGTDACLLRFLTTHSTAAGGADTRVWNSMPRMQDC